MPGLREEGTEPRVVLLRQVGRRVLGTVLVGGTWLSEPSGRGGQWGWGCLDLSVGRHPSWEPVPCVPWWRRRPSAPSVLQQRHRSASDPGPTTAWGVCRAPCRACHPPGREPPCAGRRLSGAGGGQVVRLGSAPLAQRRRAWVDISETLKSSGSSRPPGTLMLCSGSL